MKRSLFLLALMMLAVALGAQVVSDTLLPEPPVIVPDMPVEALLDYTVALYAALITVLGYASRWIPGVKKIPAVALRVLVVAAVVGIIFAALGLANGWQLVLGYLGATIGYDKFLGVVVKTPK